MLYERESHIVINYSKLDEDLKDVTLLLLSVNCCNLVSLFLSVG